MEGYISFDRFTDALASLEQLCENIEKAKFLDQAWKFAIISSHCALQGFMCIALSDGSPFNTWKENQYKKWQRAYDAGEELPDPQLDFFLELYKKLFSEKTAINFHLIEFLNETRNGLVHFNTDSYSIELGSIIYSINEAVKAVEKTPELAKGIFFYDEGQEESFAQVLKRAKDAIGSF